MQANFSRTEELQRAEIINKIEDHIPEPPYIEYIEDHTSEPPYIGPYKNNKIAQFLDEYINNPGDFTPLDNAYDHDETDLESSALEPEKDGSESDSDESSPEECEPFDILHQILFKIYHNRRSTGFNHKISDIATTPEFLANNSKEAIQVVT